MLCSSLSPANQAGFDVSDSRDEEATHACLRLISSAPHRSQAHSLAFAPRPTTGCFRHCIIREFIPNVTDWEKCMSVGRWQKSRVRCAAAWLKKNMPIGVCMRGSSVNFFKDGQLSSHHAAHIYHQGLWTRLPLNLVVLQWPPEDAQEPTLLHTGRMDLTSRVFVDLLSPLAAFPSPTSVPPPHRGRNPDEPETPTPGRYAATPDAGLPRGSKPDITWGLSFVNPQHRINALSPWDWDEPLESDEASPGQWRVDGVGADGQRVFAVPSFAVNSPPLRIDVHLPPPEEYEPAWLRAVLAPERLVSLGNGPKTGCLRRQPALQHLVRALDAWTEMQGQEAFQQEYNRLPFGSRIVVTRVVADVGRMAEGIYLVPEYDVEAAMLPVERLQDMWPDVDVWPPVVCWEDLRFKKQLHEAISVVEVESGPSSAHSEGLHHSQPHPTRESRRVVFKSLLRDQRYLYNEIKTLLSFRPHPHVAGRPLGLVVKRSRFGGRRGVCGFLMEYFEGGNLQAALRDLDRTRQQGDDASDEGIKLKLEWARKITSALIHVNAHPAGFFPDLKPDNIVLRGRDVVLLDFEQRGGWYAWSPPEVAYIEYLEVLVAGLGEGCEDLRDELHDLLTRRIAGWRTSTQRDAYWNADGGFSAPWRDLLRKREQEGSLALEKAQVYMLGKLLWCIFEETPFVGYGVDQEVLCDDVDLRQGWSSARPRFPEFRRAPAQIRELVRECTQGDRVWDERQGGLGVLFMSGGKLFAVGTSGERKDVRELAKQWWVSEVERAKRFMEDSLLKQALEEAVSRRPTLVHVLDELERLIDDGGG